MGSFAANHVRSLVEQKPNHWLLLQASELTLENQKTVQRSCEKDQMGKPIESNPDYSLTRVVCRNRKAKHEYEISQSLECGIMLHGSEVKSVRNNKISIEEAYVRVQSGEVWLVGCDIAEYPQATYLNHDPKRQRKLLLHRREIQKFAEVASQKGLALVPLDVHLDRGYVKVTIAVGKGLKRHDKREKLKEHDANREIRQAMRRQQD